MTIRRHTQQRGFTLVEMVVVIVITGILGAVVAVFLKAPVQGYVDSARRAELTDIADTAVRRITRDLRLALPNSVRVTVVGNNTYLEFLPTKGGGRYRASAFGGGTLCAGIAGNVDGDALSFTAADSCFEVLGPMPTLAAGDSIVVYNLGIPRPAACPAPLPTNCGTDAYGGDNRAAYDAATTAGNRLGIATIQFPFDSPSHRFQVVTTPVTYVCAPVAGGGTLTRYWGYAIQAAQPIDVAAAPLSGANNALLANNVSACDFSYSANVVAQRSGLVTMHLAITENGETVSLYNASHVSNEP